MSAFEPKYFSAYLLLATVTNLIETALTAKSQVSTLLTAIIFLDLKFLVE